MGVPNTFGTATSAIPLSQLDANFATPITIGNTAVQLGNTVTTLNNMTLANVTISSGNVTITNVGITNANVSGTANISTLVVVGNATVGGNATITGNITAANANVTTNLVLFNGTANGVAYLNTSKVLTTGSALVFNGTNLGVGVTPSAWTPTYRKALQLNTYSAISGDSFFGLTDISTNAYESATGTFSYITSAPAADYRQDNNGKHIWLQAASGTANAAITFIQAMTLDASGNLLVGATSADARVFAYSTTGTSLKALNPSNVAQLLIGFNNTSFNFMDADNNIFRSGNGTERARIDSSGNLLVGTTSAIASERLNVTGSVATGFVSRVINTNATDPQGMLLYYSGASPNSSSAPFLYCLDTTTVRAEIRSNGGLANYSANDVNLSDRREKTNFAPAKSYLDVICAIPVQTFNYIDQNMEDDAGLTLGVVAQDVQAIAPELVMESNWGTEEEPKMRLSIYQTDLQYALMKALQEQQSLITQLTARITALEGA